MTASIPPCAIMSCGTPVQLCPWDPCKCHELSHSATLCHPSLGVGCPEKGSYSQWYLSETGLTRSQKRAFYLINKAFSRWIPASFWWQQPRALPSSASASAFPGRQGWESNLWATGNFTGKMQTANFKLCLEIFSVFPAAARNQERGKKNPNKNSLCLFSATHFSAPVKQNVSCKPGENHKVRREELLLCSAPSSSFWALHAPFFCPLSPPTLPSSVLPQVPSSSPV